MCTSLFDGQPIKCNENHTRPSSRRMRQRILRNITRDRIDADQPITVIQWFAWPVNEWGDIGAVDITYHTNGYGARYGFDSLGNVACYMD